MTIRTRKFLGTIALAGAGGGVVADGNDGGADALACDLRAGCRPSSMSWPASAGCCRRCRSSAGWRGRTHRSRSRCSGRALPAGIVRPTGSRAWRAANAAVRPRRSAAAPADWSGPPVSNDARYRRSRAGEAGLLGHRDMLPAKGGAIAERIGEMPDIAVERGLRDRPAHRHLARCVGVLQVRQHRIVHRRASNRHIADRPQAFARSSQSIEASRDRPRGRPSIACRDP